MELARIELHGRPSPHPPNLSLRTLRHVVGECSTCLKSGTFDNTERRFNAVLLICASRLMSGKTLRLISSCRCPMPSWWLSRPAYARPENAIQKTEVSAWDRSGDDVPLIQRVQESGPKLVPVRINLQELADKAWGPLCRIGVRQ